MRRAAKRALGIALAVMLAVIANAKATLADDAEDCASTAIAAKRSAAACLRLANQGEAWAQFGLGFMYETGRGVPQNYKKALTWYRKAAEQGDAPAQYYLGNMYAHGQGVPQDDKEAATWYRKAAEQGYADAHPTSAPCTLVARE